MAMNLHAALAARPSGGLLVVPQDDYVVTEPFSLPNDTILWMYGARFHVERDDIDVFQCVRSSHTLTGIQTMGGEIWSQRSNTGGVRIINGDTNRIRDLRCRGVSRTVHLDRGMNHTVEGIVSSPHGARPAGVILVEASDGIGYCQYVRIINPSTSWPTYSCPIILYRATNVLVSGAMIHEPGNVGVLVRGDSQGVTIADSEIIRPTYGVVTQMGEDGWAPLQVTLRNVNVDQATVMGVEFQQGNTLAIQGGRYSFCDQGLSWMAGAGDVSVADAAIYRSKHNGIVAYSHASNFSVIGTKIYDNAEAGIVVSPGLSKNLLVSQCPMRGNPQGDYVDFSTGGTNKVFEPCPWRV